MPAFVRVGGQVQRVELKRAAAGGLRLFQAPHRHQEVRVPMVGRGWTWLERRRRARIDLQRPLELALGFGPVPFPLIRDQRERRVRGCEALVDLERMLGRRLGPLPCFLRRYYPKVVVREVVVQRRQRRVGRRVARVGGDRLVEYWMPL